MPSKKTVKTVSKRISLKSLLPKRPPYKFLTRNIKFCHEDNLAFNQIRIKGLYLKKFVDDRYTDHGFRGIDYRVFKNNKLFKTLRRVHISSVNKTIIHESLKTSKSLKVFSIKSMSRKTRMDIVAFYLKTLPVDIQTVKVHLFKDNQRNIEGYYQIAKSIRRLPKLQNFYRWYMIKNNNQKHVQRELLTYNKSFSRLPKLNQARYILSSSEQSGFQRSMRRDFVEPWITGLNMYLSYEGFDQYERMEPFLLAETSHDLGLSFDFDQMDAGQRRRYRRIQGDIQRADEEKKDDLGERPRVLRGLGDNDEQDEMSSFDEFDEDEEDFDSDNSHHHTEQEEEEKIISDSNDEILSSDTDGIESEESFEDDEEFVVNSIMREEMKPFYRFELFPNLKRLYITHEELLYPLGSFVVDGFAALQKLEDLKIQISEIMSSKYIFKGLLKLPLLKNFDLTLSYIGKQNWALLGQFVKNQNNLKSFSLSKLGASCTRVCYLLQSASLEGMIKYLENKTHLRSLKLDLCYCSVEAISRGLSHLKMINQFHTFQLEAIDDSITSQTKGWKRIEGLCKFIKNQKDSIKNLDISLPIAFEESVVTKIGEAFSKLTQLKKLHLRFNTRFGMNMDEMIYYMESGLQQGVPVRSRKELVMPTKWNPSLAKYMKHLENLEDFNLAFFIIHSDSTKWLVDIIKALPSLEKLRRISIGSRCGEYFQSDELKIISAVRELQNVKHMTLDFYDGMGFYQQMLPNLGQIVEETNQRQITRSDLMF